jgi:DNA-binding MarR family transcriptional regulator
MLDSVPNGPTDRTPVETVVLDLLRRDGPHTFESLIQKGGLGWSQVFGAIDSLSRSGLVQLRRIDGNGYLVSFSGSPT